MDGIFHGLGVSPVKMKTSIDLMCTEAEWHGYILQTKTWFHLEVDKEEIIMIIIIII